MIVKEIKLEDVTIVDNVRLKENVKGLMESIKQNGLLEPIGVSENGKLYTLLYGFRRLMACEKLGWVTIPAVVENQLKSVDFLVTNAIENLQREDVSPAELGRVCKKLLHLKLNIPEIAVRLGVTVGVVKGSLSADTLPDNIRKNIQFVRSAGQTKNGKIPHTHAHYLLQMAKEKGIPRATAYKLLKQVGSLGLTMAEIRIINFLMKEGLSIKEATKEMRTYVRVDVRGFVKKAELDKYGDEPGKVIASDILKGKQKPFKSFIVM